MVFKAFAYKPLERFKILLPITISIMKSKKEWLFLKSFRAAKSNPGKIGLIFLFDLLFLMSFFYVFPNFGKYLAQNIPMSQTASFAITIMLLQVVYNLLVLFAYSFFKYCALDPIKSIFQKTDFSLNRLGQFYLLNVALFLPPYILFGFILSGIKPQYQPYVFVSVGLILSIFLYIAINAAQSNFYQGNSIKKSIAKGFDFALHKMDAYKEIVLVMAIFILALGAFLWLAGYLFNFIVTKSYTSYLITFAYFKQISIIIFDAIFYFIILVNRISFYSLAKENQ